VLMAPKLICSDEARFDENRIILFEGFKQRRALVVPRYAADDQRIPLGKGALSARHRTHADPLL
jgi:hypothetical protein